jgi:serine/threonine protein kinase
MNKDNDPDSIENFLSRFCFEDKNAYDWKIIGTSEEIITVFRGIAKKAPKTLIFVKQMWLAHNNTKKLKSILKDIYFIFSLKNKKYFPKNVSIELSKDEDFVFLIFQDQAISLKSLINNNFFDSEQINLIKWIIYQITFGLYYLHSNSIIHHDIKPSNIIISGNGDISIINFDLAIYKEEKSESFELSYLAPECLIESKTIDEKIDMWSLGVVMLELYCKKNIFSDENDENSKKRKDQISHIYNNQYLNIKENYDDFDSYYTFLKEGKNIIFSLDKEILDLINDKDAIDLIYKLLNFNPNQRYSAKEVLESNYLKEFENENSLDVEKISYPFDYEEISDDEMNYEKCVKIIKKNIKKFI